MTSLERVAYTEVHCSFSCCLCMPMSRRKLLVKKNLRQGNDIVNRMRELAIFRESYQASLTGSK